MNLKYAYQFFKLADEQVDELRKADDADSICQLGCWYIFTAPTEDYVERAADCFRRAITKGSVEAKHHLSNMYRLGDFGLVNMKEYRRLRDEAIAGGCQIAEIRLCKDLAFGVGQLADLDAGLEEAQRRLALHEDPDPRWYDAIGFMLLMKGDEVESKHYFRKAIEAGYLDSYLGFAGDSETLEEGRMKGCGDCCLLLVDELEKKLDNLDFEEANAVDFFGNSEEKKSFLSNINDNRKRLYQKIIDLCDEAARLGSNTANYYLGSIYYKGKYNMMMSDENDRKAWNFFVRGSQLGSFHCYSMMAEMIEAGRAPEQYKAEDACLMRLKALRFGDDDQFLPVINAYMDGDLEDYAEEIVQNYIPRYETLEDDICMNPEKDYDDKDDDFDDFGEGDEDDYEEDDGRFDAWA